MEDDAFGRCCVACMNRCVDGCRRYPAICPGAPGATERGGLRFAERRPADICLIELDRMNAESEQRARAACLAAGAGS